MKLHIHSQTSPVVFSIYMYCITFNKWTSVDMLTVTASIFHYDNEKFVPTVTLKLLFMFIIEQQTCILISYYCSCILNEKHPVILSISIFHKHGDHSVYGPSQWELVSHYNTISHGLDKYTEWSLVVLLVLLANKKYLGCSMSVILKYSTYIYNSSFIRASLDNPFFVSGTLCVIPCFVMITLLVLSKFI